MKDDDYIGPLRSQEPRVRFYRREPRSYWWHWLVAGIIACGFLVGTLLARGGW